MSCSCNCRSNCGCFRPCCDCFRHHDCSNESCGSNANADLRKCAGYGFDGPCHCACPRQCGRPQPRRGDCGCGCVRPEPRRGGCDCDRDDDRCGCGCHRDRDDDRCGCGCRRDRDDDRCGCGCRRDRDRDRDCDRCCDRDCDRCCCRGCGCDCDRCGCHGCGCGCHRPNPCQGAINETADFVADCIVDRVACIAEDCAERAKNPCRRHARRRSCRGQQNNETTWGRCQ